MKQAGDCQLSDVFCVCCSLFVQDFVVLFCRNVFRLCRHFVRRCDRFSPLSQCQYVQGTDEHATAFIFAEAGV